MKDDFTKTATAGVLILLGLLFVDLLPGLMERSAGYQRLRTKSPILRAIEKVPGELQNGELNAEDFDALAAGYYEGLRKDAGQVGLPGESDDVNFRADFLRYEFKPNVKRSYEAGMRITNSLGMPNPEYGYEKPPHTRRIALLGDSISVGPYGHGYDALLENRLNQVALTPEVERFQVLNFAVYGYSIVQSMDVALEKIPQFHPDVYLVALSSLEMMGRAGWRTHVGRLVVSKADLKYDYLRQVAAQAGVKPTDHLPRIKSKLAPFLTPVVHWALEQIRDHAAAEGAQMIIAIVPAPIDPHLTDTQFDQLLPALAGIGVPVFDLRDTFRSAANLDDLQVVPKSDIHPNVRGHEMILENLYAKLRTNPGAWTALTGSTAPTH
jgi:GDSL-like Lipase/Acylhydrolase family